MASPHAATVLARLEGVVALDLAVADARWLEPGLRELRLTGVLEGFAPAPGQDLMVGVTDTSGTHRWRRYTVRTLDDGGLVLWITTDADGPGAAWARSASPGDRIEAVGPRGKIGLDADAAAHLFVVDDAGLAAAAALAESVVAPGAVTLVAPAHLLRVATPAVNDGVRSSAVALPLESSTHCDGGRLGAVLDAALGELGEPVTAYVFGELALVRQVRAALGSAGLDASRVRSKAYWRADRSNEANGEPARPPSE